MGMVAPSVSRAHVNTTDVVKKATDTAWTAIVSESRQTPGYEQKTREAVALLKGMIGDPKVREWVLGELEGPTTLLGVKGKVRNDFAIRVLKGSDDPVVLAAAEKLFAKNDPRGLPILAEAAPHKVQEHLGGKLETFSRRGESEAVLSILKALNDAQPSAALPTIASWYFSSASHALPAQRKYAAQILNFRGLGEPSVMRAVADRAVSRADRDEIQTEPLKELVSAIKEHAHVLSVEERNVIVKGVAELIKDSNPKGRPFRKAPELLIALDTDEARKLLPKALDGVKTKGNFASEDLRRAAVDEAEKTILGSLKFTAHFHSSMMVARQILSPETAASARLVKDLAKKMMESKVKEAVELVVKVARDPHTAAIPWVRLSCNAALDEYARSGAPAREQIWSTLKKLNLNPANVVVAPDSVGDSVWMGKIAKEKGYQHLHASPLSGSVVSIPDTYFPSQEKFLQVTGIKLGELDGPHLDFVKAQLPPDVKLYATSDGLIALNAEGKRVFAILRGSSVSPDWTGEKLVCVAGVTPRDLVANKIPDASVPPDYSIKNLGQYFENPREFSNHVLVQVKGGAWQWAEMRYHRTIVGDRADVSAITLTIEGDFDNRATFTASDANINDIKVSVPESPAESEQFRNWLDAVRVKNDLMSLAGEKLEAAIVIPISEKGDGQWAIDACDMVARGGRGFDGLRRSVALLSNTKSA